MAKEKRTKQVMLRLTESEKAFVDSFTNKSRAEVLYRALQIYKRQVEAVRREIKEGLNEKK